MFETQEGRDRLVLKSLADALTAYAMNDPGAEKELIEVMDRHGVAIVRLVKQGILNPLRA